MLVEVFAEMIFVHGFIHGDPHPGNILVSPGGHNGFSLGTFLLVIQFDLSLVPDSHDRTFNLLLQIYCWMKSSARPREL